MGRSQLNLEKREIIGRLLTQGFSRRKIASILGYTPSAISQEINRNSAYFNGKLVYKYEIAQKKTTFRRKQRMGKTSISEAVVAYVAEGLKRYWSPEQIEGRLKLDFPHQTQLRICFKTIYRWIERSKQRTSPLGTKARYTKYLRLKRQNKTFKPPGVRPRKSRNLPSIDDRPGEVDLNTVFGHWEGDLICGHKGKGYFVTMVERTTGFLIAKYCETRQAKLVTSTICSLFSGVDNCFVKTITLDRGSEFSAFEELKQQLECGVYYCHPQCPNERALNEQTNGLLRQFYPKRKATNFADKERLRWAVDLINHRPRKKFNYRTTWEVIEARGLVSVLSFV